MIELAFHELSARLPELGREEAWRIAGAIVARFRRDRVDATAVLAEVSG